MPRIHAAPSIPVRLWPQVRALRTLFRADATLRSLLKAPIGAFGLTLVEFDAIAALGNTEGLRMGELARHMIATPPNVTRVCDKLAAKGLLTRSRSAESDREVVARLTAKGDKLFRECFLTIAEVTRDIIDARLTVAEQKQLATLLEKLRP